MKHNTTLDITKWPLQAHGVVIRGDETTSEDQVAAAASPEMARHIVDCVNRTLMENKERLVTVLEIIYMGDDEKARTEFIGVFDNKDDLNAAEKIGLAKHKGKLEKSRKKTAPLNFLVMNG
jgi:hypothetical protein